MKKLELIFEDKDYIVINKPSGLLTMPGRGTEATAPNLLGRLTETLKQQIFVVHRLDKDASGLIIFAKNEAAHKYFSALFETRELKKTYLAAVEGRVKEKRGEIDKPIQAYGSGRMGVGFNGKPSVTKFSVLEHYKKGTLLEVELITGRRHQIRVHLYYVKHPILGDRLYGDAKKQAAFPRLMLHAYTLSFTDPSGKKRTLTADPPREFQGVLKCL